jgi:hypothetical protein
MNADTTLNCISADFQRRVVDCINMALQDDLPRYLSEFHPDTTNGIPHQIGDWINTNIRKHLAGNNIEVIEFTRYSWKGKIIIDRENHVTYTIMREKRLSQLRREKRDKPHYLQSIVGVLNENFIAPSKQLTLFGEGYCGFDSETIEQDYDSIFKGSIDKTDGYHHCAIIYETEHGELADINILILDKYLVEVSRISLNEYIKPDFSKLTAVEPGQPQEVSSEEESSAGLLAIRRRQETDATPVEIPEKRKQA